MGGEHARKRKHLLIYFASGLALLLAFQGCAHLATSWQGGEKLKRSQDLMDEGDFEASRREAGEALAMLDPNSRDIAFYQIGLIDANPLNPKADYIESIRSFEKIILEFPKSYLKEEAVIWVLTLKKTIEAEREISELRKELTNLETASKEREKVMKSREAAVDDKERKLNLVMQDINKSDSLNNKLKEEVKELRAKLAQLEEQLKNLKNVDLSIEKKKRETMPRQ